jgi:2-dehydropantoate 2-reductase
MTYAITNSLEIQDRVSLGIYRPDCTVTTNTPAEEALLADFYDMLEKGGTTVNIVPEIQRVKFAKNLWNLAFSSISTLVGYRLPAIFRAPPRNGEAYEPYVSEITKSFVEKYTIPNVRAIMEEALTLGTYCSRLYTMKHTSLINSSTCDGIS